MKPIVSLIATVLVLHWYKRDLDVRYDEQQKQNQQYQQELVDIISEQEKIINPNGSADQPPVSIVGAVTMGGLTLNMLEIELTIKNNSKIQVEMADWRTELSVGGIKSIRVIPSNLASVIIPAGQTRVFRLYARGDEAFPGNYKTVKDSLTAMMGKKQFGSNLYIPAKDKPAELDIAVLWDVEGNEKEAKIFNIPCSFQYPSAVWTVGTWTGYNAGKPKQQEKNPSYWDKYDTHDE